jgi:hypothetical protein
MVVARRPRRGPPAPTPPRPMPTPYPAGQYPCRPTRKRRPPGRWGPRPLGKRRPAGGGTARRPRPPGWRRLAALDGLVALDVSLKWWRFPARLADTGRPLHETSRRTPGCQTGGELMHVPATSWPRQARWLPRLRAPCTVSSKRWNAARSPGRHDGKSHQRWRPRSSLACRVGGVPQAGTRIHVEERFDTYGDKPSLAIERH